MKQKIYFKNKSNEKLYGAWYPASSGKAVIVCHGFTGHSNKLRFLKICEELQLKGISVLRFDFSGHGKSEGILGSSSCIKQQDDVISAMNYLNTLGFDTFFLIGHSMGGAVVCLTAPKDKRISGIACLGSVTAVLHN